MYAAIARPDAESVTVARVRTTGTATGFLLHGVTAGRIENCVSDRNNRGIAVSGGEGCIVVNCTIANCPDVGLSLANCPGAVVFNNGIVGSATCLSIDRPDDLHVDHNLYFGIYAGQMKGQLPRRHRGHRPAGADGNNATRYRHAQGLDAGRPDVARLVHIRGIERD